MIELIALADGRKELRQWDTKRQVKIDGEYTQIHFSNVTFGRSEDVEVVNGVADIPDKLLQFDGKLYIYGYVGTYENGYTAYEQVFDIVKRPKPAGYVFTPTQQKTLAEIEKKIGNLDDLETTAKQNLVAAINEAAQSGSGGGSGVNGVTFYPHVDDEGNLSWTNDGGLENPPTVNIKGSDYVLTNADKSDIANEATKTLETDLSLRETVFVDLDGYGYSQDGIAYPLTNLDFDNINKYNFVLRTSNRVLEDFFDEVPLSVTWDSIMSILYVSALWYAPTDYCTITIYGYLNVEMDEAVIFELEQGIKNLAGEYIVNDGGSLSVDKEALLGDIETALDNIIAIQKNLIGGDSE